MDGLISVLVVIFVVIAALGNAARKLGSQQGRQPGHRGPATPAAERAPRPITLRPMDVGLPGQTTVPIHGKTMPTEAEKRDAGEGISVLHREYNVAVPSWQEKAVENPLEITRLGEAVPVGIPGLGLTFDADSLVKGVVYAEILGRRQVRRRF